ncbi:unnamed protein product [Pneumocystis jirovecii]|uniref:N-acetyltransferase domain-containing protein n=1 Tax=Pneumocystis jirovecii TaxID=42068 RepID=L0PCF2_PNEJI|nr:unnamed protein product [Pneumocystis jirovecii]
MKIKVENYKDESQLQTSLTQYMYLDILYINGQNCAKENDIIVGTIICKLENHKKYLRASKMVEKILSIMKEKNTDEVILETEVTNKEAIILYENFGFIRDKRLHRYYLNTSDAYRLILKFKEPTYSYYQNMQTKK